MTLRESWSALTGTGDLRAIPFRRADGVLVPPEAGALCRVYDAIPGCAAAACSLAEQPPERLRFVPPREIFVILKYAPGCCIIKQPNLPV